MKQRIEIKNLSVEKAKYTSIRIDSVCFLCNSKETEQFFSFLKIVLDHRLQLESPIGRFLSKIPAIDAASSDVLTDRYSSFDRLNLLALDGQWNISVRCGIVDVFITLDTAETLYSLYCSKAGEQASEVILPSKLVTRLQ